ncbi:hypothetical protein GCM10009799_47840 [Nocardiopsis rhodophaea]|uniref:PDZ domain-containing protein n=2 Tax=Nocardiopsis rhodophaea TaxID=280238 RepID=A0ABN2TLR5_9ACTN
MTDETGPRPPAENGEQTWSVPPGAECEDERPRAAEAFSAGQTEARGADAPPNRGDILASPGSTEDQRQTTHLVPGSPWQGAPSDAAAGARSPAGDGVAPPDAAGPPQALPGPPPGGPAVAPSGTGQWPVGGAPSGTTGAFASGGFGGPGGTTGPAFPGGPGGPRIPGGQGGPGAPGGPGMPGGPGHPSGPGGPTGPGGPVGPGGPGWPGDGGPGGPWGTGPGGTAMMQFPSAPRKRRTMPVWSVVLVVALVGLVSAGVGGTIGAQLGLSNGDGGQTSAPSLNNPPPTGAPSRPPDTIAGVAQRVSPSVVSIQASGPGLSGNGSGFVIADDHVVTNNHVSSALQRKGIEVVYSDGHTSGAKVVGAAPSSDLAVLKLDDPIDVEALEFGDSDQVTVGDQVIAIGAPLGLAGTVTTGIISAVDRPVTVGEEGEETFISALQTDAAINPGNSGGPLVDEQGRVIGVNSAIATMGGMAGEQTGSIGLGFAIPSTQTERVVNELIENGDIRPAVIGAVLDMRYGQGGAPIVTDEQAGGDAVIPDGPADKAGLKAGDLIVEFDGQKVADATELRLLLSQKQPGDKVEVGYERDGKKRTTTITLGAAKD